MPAVATPEVARAADTGDVGGKSSWSTVAVAAALLLGAAAAVVLSYGLLPFFLRGVGSEATVALLRTRVPPSLVAYVSGHSFLAELPARIAAFFTPLVVISAAGLAAGWSCFRREVRPGTARTLRLLAIAAAAVWVLGYPMFTHDVFLSVGWGRTILMGINPYYVGRPVNAAVGLQLPPEIGEKMTYGPLWALVSAGLAWLGGNRALLDLALQKLLLFGAWIAMLLTVSRTAARQSPRAEAVAVLVVGWLPLSPLFSLAEAHNDVAMVAPLTLWLYLATERSARSLWAPLPLALSVLVKYIAAPLLLVEVIAALRYRRERLDRYAGVLGICGLLVLITMAPFFRDMHFFDAMRQMRGWAFLSPGEAVAKLSLMVHGPGIPIGPVNKLVLLLGAIWSAVAVWKLWSAPSANAVVRASHAILCTILLGAVGHVWPWFVLWVVPTTALLLDSAAGRLTLVFAALAPALALSSFLPFGKWINTPLAAALVLTGTLVIGGLVEGVRLAAGRRQAERGPAPSRLDLAAPSEQGRAYP